MVIVYLMELIEVKVLELQGYPTVLGDDGSTFYTLDEDGHLGIILIHLKALEIE